ncbi:MAG: ATP phosphoribosyltransferase [Planctomycetota bacterium]
MSTTDTASLVHLALPKGRMHENIVDLFRGAGIKLRTSSRGYRPTLSIPGFEAKILKPQNIVTMLAAGTRDVGFAGADWVAELDPEIKAQKGELVELLDTNMDPVRIVAAAPREFLVDGKLPSDRTIRVAGEMQRLATEWIADRGLNATFVRTYGATEVFPPEDADCIIDITQTGATLEANNLEIVDQLMTSSTRMYASSAALENPEKKARIDDLVMLVKSVLDARDRSMIEVNVSAEDLAGLVEALPCMREPTVSALNEGRGHAVRVAAPRKDLPKLIPLIKTKGGTDIVVTPIQQVVP